MRLAVLTNELPPYRRPVFEMLAAKGDIEVVAILNTLAEEGRNWEGPGTMSGVEVRLTRSKSRRVYQLREHRVKRERTLHLPLELMKDLDDVRPDVILSGEFGMRSTVAARYARKRGVPLILWSEETPFAAQGIGWGQRAIRRLLFRRADAFTAWGKPAADYLRAQGVAEERIFGCAQAIDNEAWIAAAARARALPPPEGIVRPYALAVGQLVPRKGFDVLLKAWARLPEAVKESATLAIAGNGECEADLRAQATAVGGDVRFLGAKGPEELAALYAHARVFVLPTWLDVWGLVVNEAMACGTPVLCSRGAGAAEEMIEPGVTGDAFEPGDAEALTGLLAKWLGGEDLRPIAACVERARAQSFERTVDGIRAAIAFVMR